jgi:hypothetical protein
MPHGLLETLGYGKGRKEQDFLKIRRGGIMDSEKVFPLKGYMLPLSPEGRSSLIDAPPWHYGGEVMHLNSSERMRKE